MKKNREKRRKQCAKNLLRFPRNLGFIKCGENCWQKIKIEAFSNSRDEKQAAFKPQLSRLNSFLTILGSASPLRWGHFEIFARVVFPVSVGSKKWENNPKTSGVTTKSIKNPRGKGIENGFDDNHDDCLCDKNIWYSLLSGFITTYLKRNRILDQLGVF